MSEHSVQSISTPRISYNTTSGLKSNNNCDKGGVRSETISSLLSHSLAISLIKVQKGCGNETALGILDILQDESFDLEKFKKEVSSLKHCEDITTAIVGGPIE